MSWSDLGTWFRDIQPWGIILFVAAMIASATIGYALRQWIGRSVPGEDASSDIEYVFPAVLGLLALLLGFTYSLAVERFETRRQLVIAEANAIGTAYNNTRLLPAPHNARLAGILTAYVDDRIALATAQGDALSAQLTVNEDLIESLFEATAAAYEDTKGLDFSSYFVETINQIIDLDSTRRAAHTARVPAAVFALILIYSVMTCGLLGYMVEGHRARVTAALLSFLLALSLALVLDIDDPGGRIRDSQGPMLMLRAGMAPPVAS